MTPQEEQLWNYIDGFCNVAEKVEIEKKLATDEAFKQLYLELLTVNEQLGTHLEVDEPSMSFTRNVMEQVKQEMAPIQLKTKVDQRIIYAIGGFFSVTLLALLTYAFATADFKMKMPSVNLDADVSALLNPTVLMVVLLINAALLLVYLDSLLRKGTKKTQKNGE
ncbi:anti-sigma factor family protein [Pedobacter helvus]|uniref:Anti-sigma factor family protein n=1 Tax=Pedobacter helvus TaxID=2563444 RepID=A0ABW9JGP0_9SPHI|nr:hypothetical protein [Pedobacter ureilyticus]